MTGEFTGRRVIVMGLGRFGGGVGVARWLAAQGAMVRVTDRADPASLAESVAQLDGLGVSFRLGCHDPADLDDADLLVVSPAVDKRKSEFVQSALERGIPITSEMNLFLERCAGRIVGVTGTAGKSTTAAMLHAILSRAASRRELGPARAHLGGNIGQSLLGELDQIRPDDLVVLELSSFQLEDSAALRWSPPLAVITNVSPNHLDRHGRFEEYLSCKLNICRYQRPGDIMVLGSDDGLGAPVSEIAARTGARMIHAPTDYQHPLRLPGQHNRLNAALAANAAKLLGAGEHTTRDALQSFSGLPHRLEFVATINGVRYFNDSKATTPGGVSVALAAFDGPVILIAGGQAKDALWDAVKAAGARIKRAITTGENRVALAALLDGVAVPTLSEALAAARGTAEEGDVILFSPGSPSYDTYVNYEARGTAFVQLVRAAASQPLA